MLPSESLGLESDEVGQKSLKLPTYDITHKKFTFNAEGLNSSLVQSPDKLRNC